MIFKFIRYVQPGWQFNLNPKVDGPFASCYPAIHSERGDNHVTVYDNEQVDEIFETDSARLGELGYRLWNKGYLLQSSKEEQALFEQMTPPSLKDEYRFIRKYWGTGWTFYAYLLRLGGMHNIFKETKAFLETRNVRRINPFEHSVERSDYDQYDSALVGTAPLVAVIIPTLNRYDYLKDVLLDLEAQNYPNFEVIIVDQSMPYNEAFYEPFKLRLKIIRQEERLLWTARNRAVDETASHFLLFFDDDSRVASDWIVQHLKCLDYFDASISAGVSFAIAGQKISASYGFFRWADQFDSGNVMVRRNVVDQIGFFDELFNGQRMGDAEYGIRAYINGFRSISNPRASRIHLKVSSGGLREMGSWDAFRPKRWFAPKPVPSVLYLFKKYYPEALWKNAILTGIILSNVPYRYKRYKHMLLLSLLFSLLKSPLLYVQYRRSLSLANRMIEKDKSRRQSPA